MTARRSTRFTSTAASMNIGMREVGSCDRSSKYKVRSTRFTSTAASMNIGMREVGSCDRSSKYKVRSTRFTSTAADFVFALKKGSEAQWMLKRETKDCEHTVRPVCRL